MPVPHTSGNFGDLLDPRFQKIFDEKVKQLPDRLPELYTMTPTNGRNNMTWSSVGALPDFEEFTGSVSYNSQNQGFDTTATPIQFSNGIQVERELFDDDQFNIMDQRPRALAISATRTRQKDGARLLNNAFSVDTFFSNNSEGVALCSNSHTTTSGASTANGFDNLTTSALSATAVSAARIQMRKFRGDQAEKISVMPDELWFPPDLFEIAEEISSSADKVDTANNNVNVNRGQYNLHDWEYLTDTNNWFMGDSVVRGESAFWTDRVPLEFAMVEDMDTIIAKWRGYMRYAGAIWVDWRWVLGGQVS